MTPPAGRAAGTQAGSRTQAASRHAGGLRGSSRGLPQASLSIPAVRSPIVSSVERRTPRAASCEPPLCCRLCRRFRAVSGLLIPGGGQDLRPGHPFFDTASLLFDLAREANRKGDYFPVRTQLPPAACPSGAVAARASAPWPPCRR